MVASSIHPEGCSSGRFGHVAELAIVGAGYGGTQTLAELVRQATGPLRIHLIESRRALSLGVAYSTTDGSHLLNVRAAKMGAFADDIGGFYDWLLTDAGQAAVARYCPTLEVTPDGFVIRDFRRWPVLKGLITFGVRGIRAATVIGLRRTGRTLRDRLPDAETYAYEVESETRVSAPQAAV